MEQLTLNETRILGALIEKEHTTPDNYPLSLNSLTVACNQKSNRDPVLSLSAEEVQDTVDSLVKKRLVINDENAGKRSAKIRHRFCNTEFSKWKFSPQESSVSALRAKPKERIDIVATINSTNSNATPGLLLLWFKIGLFILSLKGHRLLQPSRYLPTKAGNQQMP